MAYQPIVLSNDLGSSAMTNLGEAFDSLGRARRQDRAFKAEQERLAKGDAHQKDREYQQDLVLANQVAGDNPDLAAQIMSKYAVGGVQRGTPEVGGKFNDMQSGMNALSSLGTVGNIFGGAMMGPMNGQPQGQPGAQGGSAAAAIPSSAIPMSDPEEPSRSAPPMASQGAPATPAQEDPDAFAANGGATPDQMRALKVLQATGQAPKDADPATFFAGKGAAPQGTEPPPFAPASQPPAPTPEVPAMPPQAAQDEPGQPAQGSGWDLLQRASRMENERNKERADRILKFKNYRGDDVVIDGQGNHERKLAREQGEQDQIRARNMEQLDAAFGEAAKTDPAVAKYYPQIRAVVAGSVDPMNSETILNYIGRRAQEDFATKTKHQDLIENREYTKAEEERRDLRNFEQSKVLANINARAVSARQNDKPATPGERETGALAENLYALASEAGTMKPLSPQAQRTIIEDAALSDSFDKNPMAKAAAIKMGQYKTLEDKLSPEDNAYYSNMRELASLLLRKESGAAISAQEWSNMFARYAPVAGEPPEIAARKQTNLMRRIEAIAKGSKAGDSVAAQAKAAQGPSAAAPATAAAPMKPATDKAKPKHIDDLLNEALK